MTCRDYFLDGELWANDTFKDNGCTGEYCKGQCGCKACSMYYGDVMSSRGYEKRYIKFSRCPIEPHKGERWEKLEKVDTSQPVVLVDYCVCDSIDFWHGEISFFNQELEIIVDRHNNTSFNGPNDTFKDLKSTNWVSLCKEVWGIDWVSGIALLFKQGDYLFTTFRAYTVEKHKFYKENKGKEFWVKEVD